MRALMILGVMSACGLAARSAMAGTIHYGFDSATVDGNTVLATSGNNIQNPYGGSFTFDTTTKSEGSASLRMQGQTGQSYGNLTPRIDIGLLDTNGSTANLSGKNVTLNFKVRTDNTLTSPLTASQVGFDIRLFASDGTTELARFFRKDADDLADGSFITVTQAITDANGKILATSIDNAGEDSSTILNQVKYIKLIYSWSTTAAPNPPTTLDVHLDDFQLTGPNVTPVPEPAALSVLGLGSLWLLRRRK